MFAYVLCRCDSREVCLCTDAHDTHRLLGGVAVSVCKCPETAGLAFRVTTYARGREWVVLLTEGNDGVRALWPLCCHCTGCRSSFW
eukprot:scaffold23960_cov22-Tisochrysis_lutea.AAC.1